MRPQRASKAAAHLDWRVAMGQEVRCSVAEFSVPNRGGSADALQSSGCGKLCNDERCAEDARQNTATGPTVG